MAWWTDLAEKLGPVVNSGDGDGRPGEPDDRAKECRGLILHIADGFYRGTVAWQNNPAADVSSHFVVAGPRDVAFGIRDGQLGQCVDTDEIAWTQRLGNGRWLSIECCGFSGDALSPAQIESCAQIFARGHLVYGYPLQLATSPSGRGLGHHSMGYESGVNWGHQFCPGEAIKAQKRLILARAIQIARGTPSGQEDDVVSFVSCDGKLWLVSGTTRFHIKTPAAAAARLKEHGKTWGDVQPVTADYLRDGLGRDIEAIGVTLTEADREALADAVVKSHDELVAEIRAVVDEELDEQARAGADTD